MTDVTIKGRLVDLYSKVIRTLAKWNVARLLFLVVDVLAGVTRTFTALYSVSERKIN